MKPLYKQFDQLPKLTAITKARLSSVIDFLTWAGMAWETVHITSKLLGLLEGPREEEKK